MGSVGRARIEIMGYQHRPVGTIADIGQAAIVGITAVGVIAVKLHFPGTEFGACALQFQQ